MAALLTPLLLAWQAAPLVPRSGPACNGVWEATVLEAESDEPFAGARLEVRPPGSTTPILTRSDAQGWVRLEGLCQGALQVAAAKPEDEAARLTVMVLGPTTTTQIRLEALHARHDHHVIAVDVHGEQPTTASASQSLAGAELARTRGQGLADTLNKVSGVAAGRAVLTDFPVAEVSRIATLAPPLPGVPNGLAAASLSMALPADFNDAVFSAFPFLPRAIRSGSIQ